MDGVLNILKPPGMTSHDVVSFVRRALKIKKVGHTGTLDPGAAGVLPICIGKATRVSEYIMEKRKCYRAELKLGVVTDTQDQFGTILDNKEVKLSEAEIIDAVKSFHGAIKQIPPMYSAIKIEGKKLYELARQGIEVERKSREVKIYGINIINIKMPDTVLMDVECSAGTYIRTLCADIGEKLGCGGYMSFLLRKSSGVFNLDQALTLEELDKLLDQKKVNGINEYLVSIDKVLVDFGKVILDKTQSVKFLNGNNVNVLNAEKNEENLDRKVKVYSSDMVFLGIGDVVEEKGLIIIKPDKILFSESQPQ